ncbi:MAG: hypothetical protein IJQ10_01945 [Clostridia bacterium]|nr:hypothetical protein [Clostridia bacterium]
MRNNKRRFEKILAAGLALGSLQGNLAGAANVKKPVSYSSSNKSVVDKIWSNKFTKGALLTTAAVVGGKTLFDIGNGIYNKFRNKDIKNTDPEFFSFEGKKISDLRGSNIVVYDGKILMSFDADKEINFEKEEFKEDLLQTLAASMHEGTRDQCLGAEDKISEWYMEKGDERGVEVFEYKNDANFKKGMKERKIHYLLDSKGGVAADNNNKIGLSNNTVFRIKDEGFRFKINVSGIANLETKVFAKKMVSQHLGQGLELTEDNIEIIPDNPKDDKNTIKGYKEAVIENFAKPKDENNLRSIKFLSLPNENLVIIDESDEKAMVLPLEESKESIEENR